MSALALDKGDLVAVEGLVHFGTVVGRVEKVGAATVTVSIFQRAILSSEGFWGAPTRKARHNIVGKFPAGTDPQAMAQALWEMRERFWAADRELHQRFVNDRKALIGGSVG